MKKGIVFNIQRYSIHDGPGIRTAIFLKGCPLHCWWCHNPEGQSPEPELVYRKSRCFSCGGCLEACPHHAISPLTHGISIARRKCILCHSCSDACPSEALSIAGKEMTTKKVVEEIEKDRPFFEESDGGVTFSGGEPLLQPEFLEALLSECKKRAVHTTVDTCGYARPETIDRIYSKVDLFLYDLKIIDDQKHRKFTGASNKPILKNLKKLAEKGSNIVVSFPIIPGINDDVKNVVETAKFIASLTKVKQVNLLPYHRAGIDKYKNIDKPYKLDMIRPPTDQKIESVKKKIEAFGLKVGIGGGQHEE